MKEKKSDDEMGSRRTLAPDDISPVECTGFSGKLLNFHGHINKHRKKRKFEHIMSLGCRSRRSSHASIQSNKTKKIKKKAKMYLNQPRNIDYLNLLKTEKFEIPIAPYKGIVIDICDGL